MTHNLNKNTINGIIIGFVAAIVVSIFSSISTINYTNGVYTDLKTMYEKDIIGQNYIQTTRVNLLYCDREFSHFLLAKDETIKASTLANTIKFKKGFRENMKNAKPLYYSTEGKSLLIKVEKAQQEYFELLEGKIEYTTKDDPNNAGKKITYTNIKLIDFQFCGKRDGNNDVPDPDLGREAYNSNSEEPLSDNSNVDDDIPF